MRGGRWQGDPPVTSQTTALGRCRLTMVLLAGLVLCLPTSAPSESAASADSRSSLPAVPRDGELGFILSSFAPAIHQAPEHCPDGLARTPVENYLLTQSPEERERLSRPENQKELTSRWHRTLMTPDRRNMCTAPELFRDRPPQRTVKGRISYGLDLDGSDGTTVAPGTCAHENFIGPGGEPGIDNQLFRVTGCMNWYRGTDGVSGDLVKLYELDLASGEKSVVLLLRGVHNLEDDPNVEVILASTKDPPILNADKTFARGASFTITPNPRWRNVFKGRILHGVLTTDVKDVRLNQEWGYGGPEGHHAEWDFRRGRLRLEFRPDGTVTGIFGAYQPLLNVMNLMRFGGVGVAITGLVDCAAMYWSLVQNADGDPDPRTGECTTISTAHTVVGVPAYVFDGPLPEASVGRPREFRPYDRYQASPSGY